MKAVQLARLFIRSTLACLVAGLPGHAVVALDDPAAARSDAVQMPGLVGYWKLAGDAKDYSGHGNHGHATGSGSAEGEFNGRDCWVEVPGAADLELGCGDFSIAALVHCRGDVTGPVGDVLSKYDGAGRVGFHLSILSSAPGYNSASETRQLFFGTDRGTAGQWFDCGRPGGKSHNADALTVFDGALYAGTTDGSSVEDWSHVYRYRGGTEWEDCGRLGSGRTRGVYAMIVHDGQLVAATSASHGPQPANMDFGRVYRYRGNSPWEDIGQPGENYRLNSLASFRGKLYVCGFNIGPNPGHVYVHEGGTEWRAIGQFDGWPHTLAVHDDKLFMAYPKGRVFAYDGNAWQDLGNPFGSTDQCNQIHSMGLHRGELYAGTWPYGRIAVWRGDRWVDRGRPADATEVIAFAHYNGSLYTGTIPRAEVFRLDGDQWTSVRRLFNPPGFQPVPVGSTDWKGVSDWSRAASLTVYDGKLFASSATCHRTQLEEPREDEPRGRVYSYKSGNCVSYDRDLGSGWRHLAVTRTGGVLQLYVNGRAVAKSEQAEHIDLRTSAPLRIGTGERAPFNGRIREVRLYDGALSAQEVDTLVQATGIPEKAD